MSFSTLLRYSCLALLAVALSACVKMDITQTIDRTGKVKIAALYDFSVLASLAASGELEDGENTIPHLAVNKSSSSASSVMIDCSTFKEEQEKNNEEIQLTNLRCEDKAPNIILVTGNQKLRRPAFIMRRSGRKKIYRYRLENINQFTETSQQNSGQEQQLKNTELEDFEKQVAGTVFQGSFTIVMPGKITRSPGGIVNGNRVRFNFTDFPLKGNSVIQSEEE